MTEDCPFDAARRTPAARPSASDRAGRPPARARELRPAPGPPAAHPAAEAPGDRVDERRVLLDQPSRSAEGGLDGHRSDATPFAHKTEVIFRHFRITMHQSGYITSDRIADRLPHVGPTLCGIVAAIAVAFAARLRMQTTAFPRADATSIASTVAAAVDAMTLRRRDTPDGRNAVAGGDQSNGDGNRSGNDRSGSSPVVLPSSASVPRRYRPPTHRRPWRPTRHDRACDSAGTGHPPAAHRLRPFFVHVSVDDGPADDSTCTDSVGRPAPPVSRAPDTTNTTKDNSKRSYTGDSIFFHFQPDQLLRHHLELNSELRREQPPTLPALPPGATTIVWKLALKLPDAPPQRSTCHVTVCTSCNIAISVGSQARRRQRPRPVDRGQAAATMTKWQLRSSRRRRSSPPPPTSGGGASGLLRSGQGLHNAPTVLQARIDDGPAAPASSSSPTTRRFTAGRRYSELALRPSGYGYSAATQLERARDSGAPLFGAGPDGSCSSS